MHEIKQQETKNIYLIAVLLYFEGSSAVTHHTELPVTTSSKVNFQANKIYGGSSLPDLTKIHGIVIN